MKPKLLLSLIVFLLLATVGLSVLIDRREADFGSNKHGAIRDDNNVNNIEAGSTDFLFFESFSRYLFIPLTK